MQLLDQSTEILERKWTALKALVADLERKQSVKSNALLYKV